MLCSCHYPAAQIKHLRLCQQRPSSSFLLCHLAASIWRLPVAEPFGFGQTRNVERTGEVHVQLRLGERSRTVKPIGHSDCCAGRLHLATAANCGDVFLGVSCTPPSTARRCSQTRQKSARLKQAKILQLPSLSSAEQATVHFLSLCLHQGLVRCSLRLILAAIATPTNSAAKAPSLP